MSPFIFFRGANHLFWQDFAGDWELFRFGNAKTRTWLEGDAHADNYGAFESDRAGVVYGLNDFDESIIADYQYDVWRMAVSLVLLARQNGGFSRKKQEAVVDAFAEAYLDALVAYRGNDRACETYFTEDNTYGKLNDFLRRVEKSESRKKMLAKWTNKVDGVRRFDLSLAKLGKATAAQRKAILKAMPGYLKTLSGDLKYGAKFFKVKSIARRLDAGTGSLGTPRFYVLIEGKSTSQNDDHILDVKRQSRPAAYRFLSRAEQKEYRESFENDAHRHAVAARAMAYDPDDFLGWMKLPGGYYSVRERCPFKETFPSDTLTTTGRFTKQAEQWAMVLATDHARASEDLPYSLPRQVDKLTKGRHKAFRALVRKIAFGYADQVEADWGFFKKHLAPDDCDEV